jgi:hypothetical protein
MDCVNRDNIVAKQIEFVRCLHYWAVTVSHMHFLLELKATSPCYGRMTKFLVNWQDVIDQMPLLFASVLMVFVWITFGDPDDKFSEYSGSGAVVEVLSIALTASMWLLLVKHLVVIAPQDYQKHLVSMQSENSLYNTELSLHQSLHGEAAADLPEEIKPHDLPLEMANLENMAKIEERKVFDMNAYIAWALHDAFCWYFVLFAGFSLAAWVFEHSSDKGIFSFCFFLLDYFRRKEGLLIFKSVAVGAPGLLGSAKVAIILILIYSCVTFWVFEDEMQVNNDCTTSYQCIFKVLDAGLHGDIAGAHGDDFENIWTNYPLKISDESTKQAQWVFTITFFLTWGFILEGIVQGYIVDAFSAIRGEEDARIADSNTNCYICSLSRFELQEANIKFFTHVAEHHDRWSYLDMVGRIFLIPKSEQMTTATIVRQALDYSSRDFLPSLRCTQLQLAEDSLDQP